MKAAKFVREESGFRARLYARRVLDLVRLLLIMLIMPLLLPILGFRLSVFIHLPRGCLSPQSLLLVVAKLVMSIQSLQSTVHSVFSMFQIFFFLPNSEAEPASTTEVSTTDSRLRSGRGSGSGKPGRRK